MKAWLVVLLTFSSLSFAQEQLVVRLNENGMMKIMQMALKYNTGTNNSRTVIIPQDLYKFTIKQKDLAANPIVGIMSEISNLDLKRDLDFYLHTSDIKVTGKVDPKSLSTVISNSTPEGFDLKLSVSLTQLVVNASSLSLCEDRQRKSKKCGSGLKTTATGLKLVTLKRPVTLTSNMRLSIKNGLASVKVLSVKSNLESKNAPTLDLNFTKLEIPRIAVIINNQETELDTSKLRDEIIERKSFLGKKLLGFAGDFIASDLAEMINIYLANTQIATTLEVYRRNTPIKYEELDYRRDYEYVAQRDNTYVRPPVIIMPDYKPNPILKPVEVKPASDVMKVMMDQFALVIRHAQVDLSLKSIKTPLNKDIELSGLLNFVLNHNRFSVKNTLGNSNRTLPALDLASHRIHDINLAISEPVINGALDLVSSTGLFQELLQEASQMDALGVNSLKLHFTNKNSLKAVANVSVDLKQVRASFWSDPMGWAETGIGTWLERNNNNSVIYFPLEIEVIPVIAKNPKTGAATLSIKVNSPFTGDNLLNTYGYPSNVGKMYNIVRKGVLSKLRDQLDEYAGKSFEIDLSKFLNQSGVEFMPKSISFNQAAYLLLSLDIKDIKFNSKTPNKK